MKFLPYNRFILISPHDPKTLQRRLEETIGKGSINTFKTPSLPFYGILTAKGFMVWPAKRYINRYGPRSFGRYELDATGTRIHVTQRLDHVIAFGTVIALIAITYILFGRGADNMDADVARELAVFKKIGLLLYLPLPLAIYLVFWPQSRETKERLKSIFDAREVDGIQ